MRAGLGRSLLTPPLGVELAGYGYYLKRQAEAVNDPLYARALLLEAEGERALIVSCDLLGLKRSVCEAVKAHARQKLDCEEDHVLIVSTHTHTGPAIKYHEGCGVPNDDYVNTVADTICLALDRALSDLKEVTALSYAQRDLEGDYIYNRATPEGPVDRLLRGFILRRREAKPVAILSSACHGVFRRRVPFVSADYAGAVNQLAGEAGYESIYLNGLCGDIDPYKQTPERLATYAREIVALCDCEEKTLAPTLSCRTLDIMLRHSNFTPQEIHRAAAETVARAGGPEEDRARVALIWEKEMLERADTLEEYEPQRVTCLTLGGVPIVALPFEGFTQIGMEIRARTGRPDALVLGCAEELMGYLPTKDDFERQSYAAVEAPFLYKTLPIYPGEAERIGAELGERLKNQP